MQLLDAVLAFALTLAALATVVTIIMETAQRVLRMRRKNLVRLMKLLNDELGDDGPLGLTDEDRWNFLKGVINNPAMAVSEAAEAALNGHTLDDAIKTLGWRALGSGAYGKVSLEHVLRRLAELPKVQERSRVAGQAVKAELNRLARKFEELGSAISASFKLNAQIWTMGIGIAFAIVANVDGLRIFNAYLTDDKLTQTIIGKQEDFEKAYEEAQRRSAGLDELARKVDEAASALEASADDAALRQGFDDAVQALAAETSPEAIGQSAERARAEFTDLEALGLPIGWRFFPACPFGSRVEDAWRGGGRECGAILEQHRQCILSGATGAAGAGCDAWYFMEKTDRPAYQRIAATFWVDFLGFLHWLLIAVGTGLLIGLGAPFRFDVAKRLAQVRQMFGGKPSGETRMSGRDADGNSGHREEIVDRVVADAVGTA